MMRADESGRDVEKSPEAATVSIEHPDLQQAQPEQAQAGRAQPTRAYPPPGPVQPTAVGTPQSGPPPVGTAPFGPPAAFGPPPPGSLPAPGSWRPLAPQAPAPPPRKPMARWVPITFAGVAAAVLIGGIALVLIVSTRATPADLVKESINGAAGWRGAAYHGTVEEISHGDIDFDIAVTPSGMQGTLTRSGGAKAEIVRDRNGTLIKGNLQWWKSGYSLDAEKLADVWLAEPGTELSAVDKVLDLDPAALAKTVNPEFTLLWRQTEERTVDGQRALVVTDGFDRLLVTAEEPHRLLAIDVLYGTRNDDIPTRVAEVPAERVTQINGAAAAARGTGPAQSLTQRLHDSPDVTARVLPFPTCTTPTCTTMTTVTNSGVRPGIGLVEVSVDGTVVGTHAYSLAPGQSVTVSDTFPNSVYGSGSPGSQATIRIGAKVLPS